MGYGKPGKDKYPGAGSRGDRDHEPIAKCDKCKRTFSNKWALGEHNCGGK